MLTELLAGSGRAESIREFRLGVSAGGQRSLSLIWETPKRYSNKPSEVRSIQGNVRVSAQKDLFPGKSVVIIKRRR